MKNIFTLLTLFAVTSIFFSSCNQTTGISLTKRHYRNGYNLEVAGKRIKPATQKIIPAEITIPENEMTEQPEYASVQTSGENYIKHKPLSLYGGTEKKQNISSEKIKNKHSLKTASNLISIIKKITKMPSSLKNNTSENNGRVHAMESEHGGGGLIWTIIVILLVLWLLSLLTGGWGLGGLLYLFLVVALILILLRLLGLV